MTFEKDFVLPKSIQYILQAKTAAQDFRFFVIHFYIQFWLVTKVVQVSCGELLTQSPQGYCQCKNAKTQQCPDMGTKFIFQALFLISPYSLGGCIPFSSLLLSQQFTNLAAVFTHCCISPSRYGSFSSLVMFSLRVCVICGKYVSLMY